MGDATNWQSSKFLGYGGAAIYVIVTCLEARHRHRRNQEARDDLEASLQQYRDQLEELARRMLVQQLRVIYEGLFDRTPDRRLTLFTLQTGLDEITPWVRYEPANPQPHPEETSKARYRKGEGFTGKAWKMPNRWLFQPLEGFPKDPDREEFEKYYTKTLGIRPEVVRDLSPYMEHVKCIHSYGFMDRDGNFLGVLSVDIQHEISEVSISEDVESFGFRQLREVLTEFSRERRKINEQGTATG